MMQQHDIILGRTGSRYITLPGGEPVVLNSRTGQGKTSNCVIPNCMSWPGSLVVLDIKGEAFAATAGHRVAMGQDVYVFAPLSLDMRSHRWDPFASVDRASHRRFEQIAMLGNLIFPEYRQVGGSANNSAFWDDAGRQAFNGLATLLAESHGKGFLSMEHITSLFKRADGHNWMLEQLHASREAGQPFSAEVVEGISDYIGDDPKLRGDIRKTVTTRMQLWSFPQIAAITAASDFNLADLRRRPMTIYVTVAPNTIATISPLLRLFFDQLINLNTEATPEQDPSLKYQCLVILDEFARLGRMDSLAQAAQYTRGYGLRMLYIMQNKYQVKAIYGADAADDIFTNAGAEVYFGINGLETAKELEERMGNNTILYSLNNKPRYWPSLNWSKQNANEHLAARPQMYKQEVIQLPWDKQIVIRASMLPIVSQRCYWKTDPNFFTLLRPPPQIPRVPQIIRMDDKSSTLPPRPRMPAPTLRR